MTKVFLILIILLGLFFRVYQFKERFFYAHDNDLASWIYKDIVVDHHWRLIGQQTTTPGVFIGPLFYYLLIPFYLVTGGDPIGTVAFSWFIGLASTLSLYWVFTKLFQTSVGLLAAFLHAASFGASLNEREVVPTTPVFLWSIWFFYAIHCLFRGQKHSLVILAVLFGLIWHLNMALILLFPLVLLGLIKNYKIFAPADFLKPLLLLLLLLTPFFVFETKHGFIQTRALTTSLNTINSSIPTDHIRKLNRTLEVSVRNLNFLFWQNPAATYLLPFILTLILISLPTYSPLLYSTWIGLFILFFTFHPIILSEYYLNGLNILWIYSGAVLLSRMPKSLSALLLLLFTIHNLNLLLGFHINQNGYIYKKAVVDFISSDSQAHSFPCIAISYITDPGYNLGYRYFLFQHSMHTNSPSNHVPVYSIVFPHSLVNHIDKSFGALGLILPDYSQPVSCSDQNSNLTDPMFGFTK